MKVENFHGTSTNIVNPTIIKSDKSNINWLGPAMYFFSTFDEATINYVVDCIKSNKVGDDKDWLVRDIWSRQLLRDSYNQSESIGHAKIDKSSKAKLASIAQLVRAHDW